MDARRERRTVIGVVFFGWAALPLMIYYWFENLTIGVFNLPKILLAGLTKPWPQKILALFLTPFFAFHYGLFYAVHGAFVLAIFAASDLFAGRAEPTPDSFNIFIRIPDILRNDGHLRWSIVVLVLIQAFRFVVLWLGHAQWRDTDPPRQMQEPYGRVVVLHATILVGAIPVVALGEPAIGVFVLALFKTALELGLPQFQFGGRPTQDTA